MILGLMWSKARSHRMVLNRRMISYDLQLFLKTCTSAAPSGDVIRKEKKYEQNCSHPNAA